jgi:hypothetical protein
MVGSSQSREESSRWIIVALCAELGLFGKSLVEGVNVSFGTSGG